MAVCLTLGQSPQAMLWRKKRDPQLLFPSCSDPKRLSRKSSCFPTPASTGLPRPFSEKAGRAPIRVRLFPPSSGARIAGWWPSPADLAFARSFLTSLFILTLDHRYRPTCHAASSAPNPISRSTKPIPLRSPKTLCTITDLQWLPVFTS